MAGNEPRLGPIQLVVIQPTPFCNLDCDYCYLPNRDVKERLSLELLESIFKRIFESHLISDRFTVVWHAGEPLAMPIEFYRLAFKIVEQLNKNELGSRCHITHAFQTNATMLTREWCDLIQQHDVQIGVSLDGPAFLHNVHRKTRTGLGTHASTMRGIGQLRDAEIPFHVITVLTQDSLAFPEDVFNFFVNHHITRIGFNIDEQEGVHTSSSFSSEGAEETYRRFMQKFYQLIKESCLAFEIREFEYLKQLICHGFPAGTSDNSQLTPFNILTIDCKGNFSTFSPELLSINCHEYGDFMLGNLLEDSIEATVASKKFRAIYNDIRAGVELCEHACEYFSVCGGGAPGNKYFENGSFATSETMYCKCNVKVLTDILLDDIEATMLMHATPPEER